MARPFDFADSTVRSSWCSLLPAIFIFSLCLVYYLPVPIELQKASDTLKDQFQPYLTLDEAEALEESTAPGGTGDDDDDNDDHDDNDNDDDEGNVATTSAPLWRTLVFSSIALVETLVWIGIASFRFVDDLSHSWDVFCPILISSTWLYATARPVLNPTPTPLKDLFVLYLIHLAAAILLFGGMLFDHNAAGLPLPGTFTIIALIANLAAIVVLLVVIINMPLAIPSKRVRVQDIVRSLLFYFFIFFPSDTSGFRAYRSHQKITAHCSDGSHFIGFTI